MKSIKKNKPVGEVNNRDQDGQPLGKLKPTDFGGFSEPDCDNCQYKVGSIECHDAPICPLKEVTPEEKKYPDTCPTCRLPIIDTHQPSTTSCATQPIQDNERCTCKER